MAISKREGNTKCQNRQTDGSVWGNRRLQPREPWPHRPSKEAWLALWLVYIGPVVLTKGSLIEEESES